MLNFFKSLMTKTIIVIIRLPIIRSIMWSSRKLLPERPRHIIHNQLKGIKRKDLDILNNVSMLRKIHEIAVTHTESFGKYKNAFVNRDVVVLGSGPTLNEYKPIKNAIHVGVNTTYEAVQLDYLFVSDFDPAYRTQAFYDGIEQLDCEKFFAYWIAKDHEHKTCSEWFAQRVGANRFFADRSKTEFPVDIRYHALGSHGSVIFHALQFALFANPKRIFLVGCDVSDNGHFNGDTTTDHMIARGITKFLYGYEKLKQFASLYYPNTEIISINPIGLKGMFADVFNLNKINENRFKDYSPKLKINDNDLRYFKTFHVMQLHSETFSKYRHIYAGRNVVVLASGPTLNLYKPIEGAIHIGVNTVYQHSSPLDYLFVCDFQTRVRNQKFFDEVLETSCIKFFAYYFDEETKFKEPSESYAAKAKAERYFTNSHFKEFLPDLRYNLLASHSSVVFHALQFALFTNPKRIYLVGCDASDEGKFNGDAITDDIVAKLIPRTMIGYNRFKKFACRYYPDTEIVSLNPVGLKGIFIDEYTANGEANE